MELEKIIQEVKQILSAKRFEHSLGTMERAEQLAKIYGEDVKKAMLVGITHDTAKEMSEEENLEYVKRNHIEVDEIEKEVPSLLHGKIGADMVAKKYHFSEEMQRAIIYHTIGKPQMTLLEKILFVADKTERSRQERIDHFEEKVRLADSNLDAAMVDLLNESIDYTIRKSGIIHPDAILARNAFLRRIKNKE